MNEVTDTTTTTKNQKTISVSELAYEDIEELPDEQCFKKHLFLLEKGRFMEIKRDKEKDIPSTDSLP